MGEERYIIAEMGDWGQPVGEIANYVVTEDELRQRLFLVAKYLYTGGPKIDPISILIHGEWEKDCVDCGKDTDRYYLSDDDRPNREMVYCPYCFSAVICCALCGGFGQVTTEIANKYRSIKNPTLQDRLRLRQAALEVMKEG